MHVLMGLVMVVMALFGARRFDGAAVGSLGHLGTILLVVLGPIGAAVMSHDWRAIVTAFRRLADALAGRATERRKQVLSQCYEVGRALRQGRAMDASHILQSSPDPL